MPTMPTEVLDIAQWLPRGGTQRLLVNRDYGVPSNKRGLELPAHQRVSTTETTRDDLAQLKIFTDLPTTFYTTFVSILAENTSSVFPCMGEDKSPSVRGCLQHLADSADKRTLAPENWEKLGWVNRESYEIWLDTPVLFAFSGSGHYCSSPRVFEFDHRDANSIDHFRLTALQAPKKTTNIFSVAGFEYRGYRDSRKIDATIDQGLVKQHATILMDQILYAATVTETTDVVMIPVGMGVFLPTYKKDALKAEILQGCIDALNHYPETKPLSVHCCLLPGQFEQISSHLTNPNIFLQNREGQDAYTVANAIGGLPGRKSMLVNAGDHDWIVQLKPGKAPGQCSLAHTLSHSTSDEYFALLTEFARFSIGNLKKLFSDISPFVVSRVRSSPHLVARLEPGAPARGLSLEEDASLKMEQVQLLCENYMTYALKKLGAIKPTSSPAAPSDLSAYQTHSKQTQLVNKFHLVKQLHDLTTNPAENTIERLGKIQSLLGTKKYTIDLCAHRDNQFIRFIGMCWNILTSLPKAIFSLSPSLFFNAMALSPSKGEDLKRGLDDTLNPPHLR